MYLETSVSKVYQPLRIIENTIDQLTNAFNTKKI